MIRYIHEQPGYPVEQILQLTRQEFFNANLMTPITIVSEDKVEVILPSTDKVWCVICNEDPGETIYVAKGTYVYCHECFTRGCLPFCRKVDSGFSDN